MQLSDLKSADVRRINGCFRQASAAESHAELDAIFLEQCQRAVCCDFACLNRQSHDFWTIYSATVPGDYIPTVLTVLEPANTYLKQHPMLGKITYEPLWKKPYRMSDYTTQPGLRSNPLYMEAYRHLGTNYQMGMNAARLPDCNVVFTFNREKADFSRVEMQALHYYTLGMKGIITALDKKVRLREGLSAVAQMLERATGLNTLDELTVGEINAITALMQSKTQREAASRCSIGMDTYKKTIGSVREKLLLENSAQLRALLKSL